MVCGKCLATSFVGGVGVGVGMKSPICSVCQFRGVNISTVADFRQQTDVPQEDAQDQLYCRAHTFSGFRTFTCA